MSQSDLKEAESIFASINKIHNEIGQVLESKLQDDGMQEKFLTELYAQKAALFDKLIKFDNSPAGELLKTKNPDYRNTNIDNIREKDKQLLAVLKKKLKDKAVKIRNLASQKSLLIYSKEK